MHENNITILLKTEKRKAEKLNKLLLSFSVYTNGKNLLGIKYSSKDIGCIHGLRAISIICIILIHRNAISKLYPTINSEDISLVILFILLGLDLVIIIFIYFQWYNNLYSTYVYGFFVAVDTFFVLSGMLLCINFLKERDLGKPFNVFTFYLKRYIRLTPPLAAAMLFGVVFALNTLIFLKLPN